MNKINSYKKVYNMEKISKDWRNDIYDVFKDIGISLVSHIPDAGHTPLINLCEKDNKIDVVTLTTEEEGVGLSCGAWAGGKKVLCLCNQVELEIVLMLWHYQIFVEFLFSQ